MRHTVGTTSLQIRARSVQQELLHSVHRTPTITLVDL